MVNKDELLPLTHAPNLNSKKQHSSSSNFRHMRAILIALVCVVVFTGLILLLESYINLDKLWNTNNNNNTTTTLLANKHFNSIDACWRNDPNWASHRKKLADCATGFGRHAIGAKYGDYYVVTDESDDTVDPAPGTLRYGLRQYGGSTWITFARDMSITLQGALFVPSHTTIDGRGAHVTIGNGGPCLVLRSVRHVIIHGISLDRCTGGFNGDAITVYDSDDVWIDHNRLSAAYDGLIDVVHGSTDVTVSNNYFENHNKVMLMGHSDLNKADEGLRVSVAYNKFGPKLTQRMPRCRYGYCHVVNNDYSEGWGLYAMGGSARPTIVSQGNLFRAPESPDLKRVTRCMDEDEKACASSPWKSIHDTFLDGAYFITPINPTINITHHNQALPSRISNNNDENEQNHSIKILEDGIAAHLPFAPFLTASAGPLSCTPGLPC